MEAAFRHILLRLPFPIREFHPDNGSEFLNDQLLRFWQGSVAGLRLSRSRPYRKNDNRFVEQKNASLVRAFFGAARFDTPAQCAALDALYDQLWVYYNLFQPVLHLVAKHVEAGRVRRQWDRAQTPYARLAATPALLAPLRVELDALYRRTNPRALRRAIYAGIHALLLGGPVPTAAPQVRAAS